MRSFALLVFIWAGVSCVPVQAVPTGPFAAPITVGQRPIRPVPAFGAIWVASAADGTVVRIDPATAQITATVRVADPQRLIAMGCAPSSEHAYATGSFGLRACDAPSAVAAGAGALWAVANDTGSLVRIDPSTAVITATISLGFGAWGVVAADDAVWASDYTDNAVVRIEPRTLTVRSRIPVSPGPTELAIGPGALWVLNSASGLVTRIDTARDSVVATIPGGDWAVAIAIWEDDVWVRGGSDSGSHGLIKIDARSNTVVATYPAGALLGREGVSSLAATASGVWVPGVSLDLVGRDGGVLSTIPQQSYAVASDGATLWLLDVFGHLAGVPLPHR